MSRGEEQKPVTDSYRSNWDTVFRKKDSGLVDSENEKAPPVETEPCEACRGPGDCQPYGHVCVVCGGEGVIPLET